MNKTFFFSCIENFSLCIPLPSGLLCWEQGWLHEAGNNFCATLHKWSLLAHCLHLAQWHKIEISLFRELFRKFSSFFLPLTDWIKQGSLKEYRKDHFKKHLCFFFHSGKEDAFQINPWESWAFSDVVHPEMPRWKHFPCGTALLSLPQKGTEKLLLLLLWAVLGLGLEAGRAQLSPHTDEQGAGRAARNAGSLMDFRVCQVKGSGKYEYLSIWGHVLKTAGNE